MATTTATQIQQLYVGLLGRAADQGGLNWWADQVTTGGKTLEDVRASFVTSTEYTTTYGAAATRADLVTSIYQNLFERTPSADEVKYWAETDTRPADQLVAAFIEFAGAADQAVINNKTFVAQTYTDTAGDTNFNATAAAASIATVDGTAASVSAALAAISNGTLGGLVPGVALINAVSTTAAAIDTFAKATAVANPTFDTGTKDGSVTSGEADAALGTATDARLAAITAADATIVAAISTERLSADKADATTAAASAKTAATKVAAAGSAEATANAKAIADFDAAVVAKAALVLTPEQTQAANVAKASASAGVESVLKAADYAALAVKAGVAIADIGDLYAALKADVTGAGVNVTALNHAALVAEVVKIPGYGSALVASAEKELAVTKAANAVTATKIVVDAIDSDAAAAGSEGADYTAAATTLANKTAALAAAQKGDVAVATAKAVVDQYATLNKASDEAKAAIVKFNLDNGTKLHITELTASVDATAKQDVFYFPTKIDAANDFAIGGGSVAFGAGDSIVLGSGYSFNSGALSTGNNSALEVFFVKGATGTQVVIETNAVGSATTVVGADGTITGADHSSNAAVINLVGVTADHLSFNNGVVSYV